MRSGATVAVVVVGMAVVVVVAVALVVVVVVVEGGGAAVGSRGNVINSGRDSGLSTVKDTAMAAIIPPMSRSVTRASAKERGE